MKNYLIYPCKYMRITQSYTGTTSHKLHTTGTPKDYPIDEGGKDTGRDYMYCPCDEMVVKRIYGVGNSGVNTLWLESTSKVNFADGTENYFTMQVTHPDDSEFKNIKVGTVFKRKEKICREGKDGATGYHLHFSGGKGKLKGNGWLKNSSGKWVLNVTDNTCEPENLFFVDPDFTEILDSKALQFKALPDEKEEKYKPGTYKVSTATLLHVRKGPGIEYSKKKYYTLTASARKQIKELIGTTADGYVKGVVFTVSEVRDNWGKTPSGWVCLDYCEAIK